MSRWKLRIKGGPPVGPLETDLVVRGIRAGRVPFDAEVCAAGSDCWLALASIEDFYEAMGLDDARTRVVTSSAAGEQAHSVLGEAADDEPATDVMQVPPGALANGPSPLDQPAFRPAPALEHRAFAASRAVSPFGGRRRPFPPAPDDLNGSLVAVAKGRLGIVGAPPEPERPLEQVASAADFGGPPPCEPPSELMDATEDADDVRVMVPAITTSGRTGPAASGSAGPSNKFRPDRPDELTAPALRVLVERRRARLAWAAVAALSVALLALLALLAQRL